MDADDLRVYNLIDEDCAEFERCSFGASTLDDVKEFLKQKKKFLEMPNEDTRYEMKYRFQIAHSALKVECSCHRISSGKLYELTELLRK